MRPIKLYKRDRGVEGSQARWVCECGYKTDDVYEFKDHKQVSYYIKAGKQVAYNKECESYDKV